MATAASVSEAWASLHHLTEGQVEQSAAAGSVLSVAFIRLMLSEHLLCSSLSTESNLSRCGFRGSSHIGIPYSTKVLLLKPRAPKCGLSSCTEHWIFVCFFFSEGNLGSLLLQTIAFTLQVLLFLRLVAKIPLKTNQLFETTSVTCQSVPSHQGVWAGPRSSGPNFTSLNVTHDSESFYSFLLHLHHVCFQRHSHWQSKLCPLLVQC